MPEMRRCSSSTASDSRIREPLSEDELRSRAFITPDDVLRLNKITNEVLHIGYPLNANEMKEV
uniref:Uncharacterized protein n=1 Tax=Parascaris equorum TaxID=6256 RepID=A0A914RQP7_PAREQ